MKLEPVLIKKILQFGEDNLPDKHKSWNTNEMIIQGYTKEQMIFHTKLLWENGYIDCEKLGSDINSFIFIYNHLTLNGYQYLNLLNSKAWNSAKSMMKDVGVIFVEGAIKAVIEKLIPSSN